jgi:hypothetical protein
VLMNRESPPAETPELAPRRRRFGVAAPSPLALVALLAGAGVALGLAALLRPPLVLFSVIGPSKTEIAVTLAPPASAPTTTPLRGAPRQLILPGLKEYESPNAILLPGRLYPLGWSKEGLFAYVYEPPDEACGCYFFRLIVQDMVSDEVLWEYRYDSEELSADKPDPIEDLADMWRAHGDELEDRLLAFGIIRARDAALTPLPQAGPEGLGASFRTGSVPEEKSHYGYAYLSSYELEMSSAAGKKTIFRSGELDRGPLHVSSPGYLKSPFEPRAAVLIEETWRGWEGSPHVVQLRFSGCDLRGGWR